ncbi:MAG: hypothetical protein E5Y06_31550 [Mesorhizobium sp.]|uniref:MAE_28990/MAE_18760 family HEPN-like nuclease n=1 Tax=Mesorhizobium sp. TaxID=1871066 RepID=UPI0011FBB109|nr:hypothetical protein [Mesorhizobium sp.]TIN90660.1 MAG: hypothetical protein E5Y06_31550 [Mesorhizobium sp.]TJU93990.1 MAG: hypothetical protein E5Y08_31885 [Mesorhizobium sp.]
MDLRARFTQRSDEVASYLSALGELERSSATAGRELFATGTIVAASRAAAFIMIYNAVEDAVRHAFAAIRRDIEASHCSYVVLAAFWQEEIVRAHFERKLAQGSSHDTVLREFARFVPGTVSWKDRSARLPFVGNVDNRRILKAVERMELQWRPPLGTLGGDDLSVIRQQRNALAHGFDSFEAVGTQFDTVDLGAKLDRTRTFVDSLLEALQRYRETRGFERQAPGSSSSSQ